MRWHYGGNGNQPAEGTGGPAKIPGNCRFLASSPSDRIDYITAMVRELQAMSAQSGHCTLTRLLEMAYQEALRRRRGLNPLG